MLYAMILAHVHHSSTSFFTTECQNVRESRPNSTHCNSKAETTYWATVKLNSIETPQTETVGFSSCGTHSFNLRYPEVFGQSEFLILWCEVFAQASRHEKSRVVAFKSPANVSKQVPAASSSGYSPIYLGKSEQIWGSSNRLQPGWRERATSKNCECMATIWL